MSSPRAPKRSRRSRSTRRSSGAASSTPGSHAAAAVRRLFVFSLLLLPAGALAHELGTIRVSARFQKNGTYQVDAIVDRQHLPPGFGAAGRIAPRFGRIEGLTPELERRIGGLVAA